MLNKIKELPSEFKLVILFIVVIIIIGIFDVSNSDAFLVNEIFKISEWDLPYIEITGLLLSIFTGVFIKREYFRLSQIESIKIKAISAFYGDLQNMVYLANTIFSKLHNIPSGSEKDYYENNYNQWSNAFNDFLSKYNNNKLFVDSDIIDKIDELIKHLHKLTEDYKFSHFNKDPKYYKPYYESINQYEEIRGKLMPFLEDSFRDKIKN